MAHEPRELPDLPRVRFGVSYRFADYRAFVLDHIATRAPRMNAFARSAAAWASFAAFAVKKQRLGACSFVVDASGLVRTGGGGSAQVPWADVAAIHRYRAGYLVETCAGAMPLPYRALDAAHRAALDRLFEWHEAWLAQPAPDADRVADALRGSGMDVPAAPLRLARFGHSTAESEKLIALVIDGRKRATSSLLWAYEAGREEPPRAGDVEIVMDAQRSPRVVIRITGVAVVPFNRVDDAFAAREGEGDASLVAWRREHWRFFSAECARLGRRAQRDMPVVCQAFDVVGIVDPGDASLSMPQLFSR